MKILVSAWKKLSRSNPGAELLICGEGPLAEWIGKQAGEVSGLRYLGTVGGAEKQRLLAESLAVVVPSVWWEPLGIVVYEAYDHARPVIAAASGGLKETVIHGRTGLLHEAGDADELARCMTRLLEDPETAEEMGRSGREFLLRHASPEAWEDSINRAFTEIVGRNTGGTGASARGDRVRVCCYLADQNPGFDRSFGISRMSQIVLESLEETGAVEISAVVSKTSRRGPENAFATRLLPWGTRRKSVRFLTDHLHPLIWAAGRRQDVYYFPKGYLPLMSMLCQPSVVTIHDTIIQHYEDHYPAWRDKSEYSYWAMLLKHTLRQANHILTVSEFSKTRILEFMARHGIPEKEVIVTYEPCLYEKLPQPVKPLKRDAVMHLASVEPHKRPPMSSHGG